MQIDISKHAHAAGATGASFHSLLGASLAAQRVPRNGTQEMWLTGKLQFWSLRDLQGHDHAYV